MGLADHVLEVLAVIAQPADTASGRSGPAGRLTESNKEVVYLDPILLGKHLGQVDFRLFGGPGLDEVESVRDPVDVRVDRYGRDPESVDQYAICSLSSDQGQAEKTL